MNVQLTNFESDVSLFMILEKDTRLVNFQKSYLYNEFTSI